MHMACNVLCFCRLLFCCFCETCSCPKDIMHAHYINFQYGLYIPANHPGRLNILLHDLKENSCYNLPGIWDPKDQLCDALFIQYWPLVEMAWCSWRIKRTYAIHQSIFVAGSPFLRLWGEQICSCAKVTCNSWDPIRDGSPGQNCILDLESNVWDM